MSSEAKKYTQYAYIAGMKIPILSTTIGSQFGSLASLSVNIGYSPFITRLYEYTKIQIWEQVIEHGIKSEPYLEFDGVIIGIQRRKNLIGETSVNLNCLTDGMTWNIRKQADFYLTDIVNADFRGTGDILNMRSDGQIGNFFSDILQANRFDIGCSIASILTSHIHYTKETNSDKSTELQKDQKPDVITSYYEYNFNGKKYFKKVLPNGSVEDKNANPDYYKRFLDTYKLANKVYGVSTSKIIKDYFHQDQFVSLITNTMNDVYGENTFWQLALKVAEYGFFNVYDIPNASYISSDNGSGKIDVETLLPNNGNSEQIETEPKQNIVTVISPEDNTFSKKKKVYKGLAEYIFKPISVTGIPFKCNIIWPDQIVEESIFYDFFNMPTRVRYRRKALPDEKLANILTTKMFVGPDFKSTGYLKSFTLPNRKEGFIRSGDIYTPYEKEYGIKYFNLNLSFAFDTALLSGTDNEDKTKTEKAISKVNKFLNYEFSQKFLGSRQYTVSVTPDCNPVAGFPIVIMNRNGEHVIAFCTGVRKSWAAGGQKTVSLTLSYPRYYFEDLGDLGNIIDTISQDPIALEEVSKLIDSSPIDGITTSAKSSKQLKIAIRSLFEEYLSADSTSLNKLKESYRRTSCTLNQFMLLYDKSSLINKTDIPNDYLLKEFNSSKDANELSCHYFEVYDTLTRKVVEYKDKSVQDILTLHLDWIKDPKRI